MTTGKPTTTALGQITKEIRQINATNKRRSIDRLKKYEKKYPKSIPIKIMLAEAYSQVSDFESAQQIYATSLALEPNNAAVFVALANTLLRVEKLDAAEKALKHAQQLLPAYAETYRAQGELYLLKQEPDMARKKFEHCLALNPKSAEALRRLGTLKKYTQDDPYISLMESYITDDTHEGNSLANLHFAYAKAMEDTAQYEKALSHYMEGGNLRKSILKYDHSASEREFAKIRMTCRQSSSVQLDTAISPLPFSPIFIIGMPRSGTTLLESIVSAHTFVTAGGELNLFQALYERHLTVGNPTKRKFENIRHDYRAYCENAKLTTPYFTDKMPQNFRYVSLISRCFPEAKIVHVSRDPRATCWSNFKHFFPADGLAYTWDIDDTVAYYNMYLDLMDFHREHMVGEMIEVQYEDLVADPDTEIRKLIAALGLDWQDACLEPQKNKRAVRTASQMQVQKGIYKGSSDGWRKFEPFLAEAFSKLKGLPPEA